MTTILLAAFEIRAVVMAVLMLLGVGIIAGLLWWTTGKLQEIWNFPDIISKIAYTIIIVFIVIAVIDVVMRVFFGSPLIIW